MFADYQALVLQSYLEKKAANQLSLKLIHPTPARLRNECEAIIDKRQSKKDLNTLRSFFGDHADATAFGEAIRKIDVDLFRPLDKFMKGSIKNTDQKNIELLAWLIDYEPRPYRPANDIYSVAQNVSPAAVKEKASIPAEVEIKGAEIKTEGKDNEGEKEIAKLPQKKPALPQIWKVAALIGLLVLIALGCYAAWLYEEPQGCMVWAGDYYQPVSCNQKLGNAMVLALDTMKVAHFKKITRPDTITDRSLGKVWYSKINNNVEFYTCDGFHPIHVERRLKPVTSYMINRYIAHTQ